ncbi:MAG: FHA domain-containing protein [Steroidobacteraceae bacterium]
MGNHDRDNESGDGIVADDLTLLVEHIELPVPNRLMDAPEWEMAKPAVDHDDASDLIEEGDEDIPELELLSDSEPMGVVEDIELFTDTQFDIGRHLSSGALLPQNPTELAAERARWQRRVDRLLMGLKERDRQIAERDRRIEELSAQLAARSLEPERLDAGLADIGDAIDAALAETPRVEAPGTASDLTGEFPQLDMRATVAPAADAVPSVRRYLIGVDNVGQVHEVARYRVNIGRTQDNDMRIVDPTVSRLHAMLTLRGGDAMLVDANSRNGVFVNGIQVRYAKLEDGDLVTFGTVRYRYRIGSTAAAAAYSG